MGGLPARASAGGFLPCVIHASEGGAGGTQGLGRDATQPLEFGLT